MEKADGMDEEGTYAGRMRETRLGPGQDSATVPERRGNKEGEQGRGTRMRTRIIEGVNPDGLYLKAMVCRFDQDDWGRKSLVGSEHSGAGISLLRQEGWSGDHFIIQDLSLPGPGGIFHMGGLARADLENSPDAAVRRMAVRAGNVPGIPGEPAGTRDTQEDEAGRNRVEIAARGKAVPRAPVRNRRRDATQQDWRKHPELDTQGAD